MALFDLTGSLVGDAEWQTNLHTVWLINKSGALRALMEMTPQSGEWQLVSRIRNF
jgi:hypothetical protein